MKIERRPSNKARIEIIPMIDVVFFLLVFFMVSSLAMTKINSLPVALPKTSANPTAIKQDVVLTIRKDGKIFINKDESNLESVGAKLAYALKGHSDDVLMINGDEGVNYGLIVKVMNEAREIGVRKFALATEANGKKE